MKPCVVLLESLSWSLVRVHRFHACLGCWSWCHVAGLGRPKQAACNGSSLPSPWFRTASVTSFLIYPCFRDVSASVFLLADALCDAATILVPTLCQKALFGNKKRGNFPTSNELPKTRCPTIHLAIPRVCTYSFSYAQSTSKMYRFLDNPGMLARH
jgi:hypothetical protein